jgi:hypothetical protein
MWEYPLVRIVVLITPIGPGIAADDPAPSRAKSNADPTFGALAAAHPAWPAFGRRYFSPEVAAAKLSSPSKDHVMRLSQQLYLKQVGTAFVSICVGISLYSATMN